MNVNRKIVTSIGVIYDQFDNVFISMVTSYQDFLNRISTTKFAKGGRLWSWGVLIW